MLRDQRFPSGKRFAEVAHFLDPDPCWRWQKQNNISACLHSHQKAVIWGRSHRAAAPWLGSLCCSVSTCFLYLTWTLMCTGNWYLCETLGRSESVSRPCKSQSYCLIFACGCMNCAKHAWISDCQWLNGIMGNAWAKFCWGRRVHGIKRKRLLLLFWLFSFLKQMLCHYCERRPTMVNEYAWVWRMIIYPLCNWNFSLTLWAAATLFAAEMESCPFKMPHPPPPLA